MSRPSAFAVFMTIFCAFVVMAAHLGTIDHSMHMTGSDMRPDASAAVGAPAAAAMDSAPPMTPATALTPSSPMPAHRPGSGGMTMVMVCELMVLVTILGVALRRLITVGRFASVAATIRPSSPTPSTQGLRPPRPPGLSMLCVVRC